MKERIPCRTTILTIMLMLGLTGMSRFALAAVYTLDPAHSFVNFRISHLGFSWLTGRFTRLSGKLAYDPQKPEASSVSVSIDTTSFDSGHSERNIHIKGPDYLDAGKYPEATFVSTGYQGDAENGILSGQLTLHGVTRDIRFEVSKVGQGNDPWGGYRTGFEGSVTIRRSDYGMESNLGPLANEVYLDLFIEAVRDE